jgi:hypothetical protein
MQKKYVLTDYEIDHLTKVISSLSVSSVASLSFIFDYCKNLKKQSVLNLARSISKLWKLEILTFELHHAFEEGPQEVIFNPTDMTYIFDQFAMLSGLHTLNLRLEIDPTTTAYKYGKLSKSLNQLVGLNSLNLNLKYFHPVGEELDIFSRVLINSGSTLKKLSLNLKDCFLDDTRLSYLSQALVKLPELKKIDLNLSLSHISDEGLTNLSKILNLQPKLEKLHLDLSSLTVSKRMHLITDKGLEQFASYLNNRLIALDLNFSGQGTITDKGIEKLSLEIMKLTNLKSLTLNMIKTKVSSQGAQQLQDLKGKLTYCDCDLLVTYRSGSLALPNAENSPLSA